MEPLKGKMGTSTNCSVIVLCNCPQYERHVLCYQEALTWNRVEISTGKYCTISQQVLGVRCKMLKRSGNGNLPNKSDTTMTRRSKTNVRAESFRRPL